jgi:multiple antibiotic resistance protein
LEHLTGCDGLDTLVRELRDHVVRRRRGRPETGPIDARLLAQAFVTIVVIMDPVGNAPVFLALTRHRPDQRHRAALQATLVAAGVILTFAAFGQQILYLLGISIPALQVSGGLILVLVSLQLLDLVSGGHPTSASDNVALVPLGTPLLAGPGAIAATMVYMRSVDDVREAAAVVAALVAALVVVYLALRYAAVLARVLGDNGINLLSRVIGLLLAAIAIQLVAEGVDQWVRHGIR